MTPINFHKKEKPLTSLVSMGGGAAGMANAGGAESDPLYVDDVFSTYLWQGSNTTRPVNNGIKLGNAGAGSGVEFDRIANPGNKDYLRTLNPSSDFTMGTGDFTVECWVYIHDVSIISGFFQISNTSGGLTSNFDTVAANWESSSTGWQIYGPNNTYTTSNSQPASNNTWNHVALVRSSGTTKFYVNGTSVISVADTTNYNGTYIAIGGSYSTGYLMDGVISNLRVVKGQALYTSNFTPTTKELTTKSQGATASNVKLLCCNSSSPIASTVSPVPIYSIGNPFASFGPFTADDGAGGMVIIKQRNSANPWFVTDTERGATKTLRMAQGGGQSTDATALMSFNNNGFTVGNDGATNGSDSQTYLSHTFRAAKGFFDVVKYTGTGSPQNIPHNLGSAPGAVIVRRYDGAEDWDMLHVKGGGKDYYYQINQSTAARQPEFGAGGFMWGDQNPTATHFTVGSHGRTNESGWEYVAYVFADDDQIYGEDKDQSVIKCGTFTTDGSGNSTVNLGWEPQWLMVKRYDGTGSWSIWDTMRGWHNFTSYDYMQWNNDDAETGNANYGSPYARGFHNNGNIGANANGIYIAIRRPDGIVGKPIVSPGQVFAMNVGNASSTIPAYDNPNFPVDYGLEKRSNDTNNWWSSSRITGGSYVFPNVTNTQSISNSSYVFDSNAGYIAGTWANSDTQAWMWRRYAGMDVQAYTGSGTADFVYHGLGKIPEMIWVKARNASTNWRVYHKNLGTSNDPQDYYITLNRNDNQTDNATVWNDAVPEVNRFTVGTAGEVNSSGTMYVAMLFASVEGISSVGTYTGSNSDVTINCGFTPRFIIVKALDSGRHWFVFGSTPIPLSSSGNDSRWILNDNTPRIDSTDYVNTTATGFVMKGGVDNDTNGNIGNYIYYAHA